MAQLAAEQALFGEQSLTERFGGLTGRELQEKVFAIHQAGLGFATTLSQQLLFLTRPDTDTSGIRRAHCTLVH